MGIKRSQFYLLLVASSCLSLATTVFGQGHFKRHPSPVATVRRRLPSVLSTRDANGLVQVDTNATHVLNTFTANQTLGGSIDAIGYDGIPTLFTPANVSSILSSGTGSLTYRLYTELNVQDWHWNPNGVWSDSANHQGYFVGSSALQTPITDSYGYLLAHRGSTSDQGDQQDYSRITDGDATTYWKSNPYLTSAYTHEADSLHPQWVILDLGKLQGINGIRITWANPYAVTYLVQYWTGADAMYDPLDGQWATFTGGTVSNGTSGTVTLKLASTPVTVRYVRVLMTQSSGTFDTHGSSDPRNRMGYAISEIGAGTMASDGTFTDLVTHAKSQSQTNVYVSSTDPWHVSTALNALTEQVGLDYAFASPLSQSIPMLVPVPMVYSTPENAVSEVTYLNSRKYPLIGIELGEEPDGQFMTPEDYGAFYIQWSNAIHAAYPNQKLGGPVLSNSGVVTWPDAKGETDWVKRFVAYLISHGALPSLSFVSTEHYPFYKAAKDWSLLSQEPASVQSLFNIFSNALVPKGVPVYVTEYNFDSAPSVVSVDIMGALWQSIFVGEFLNRGGQGAFFYQNFPVQLGTDGVDWGLLGMFRGDANDQILGTTAQYFSNSLMCHLWCKPGSGIHSVLPATSNIKDSKGNLLVLPYALSRPDGAYSIMIVNIDTLPHTVGVSFTGSTTHSFTGLMTRCWMSPSNYQWNPNGANGTANPNGPLQLMPIHSNATTSYYLPAQSITVLMGKIL